MRECMLPWWYNLDHFVVVVVFINCGNELRLFVCSKVWENNHQIWEATFGLPWDFFNKNKVKQAKKYVTFVCKISHHSLPIPMSIRNAFLLKIVLNQNPCFICIMFEIEIWCLFRTEQFGSYIVDCSFNALKVKDPLKKEPFTPCQMCTGEITKCIAYIIFHSPMYNRNLSFSV